MVVEFGEFPQLSKTEQNCTKGTNKKDKNGQNYWNQNLNIWIGNLLYIKTLHAVSDYKKGSYKTQRWILGKI